ncbi:MAG: MMPL family transporter [Clostridia bacterium]|nr:MMPL family transporter [Clostridia bacterium]
MIDKIAGAIGRFCYKFRIVLSILGVVIFAVVIYTESLATITYTNDAQMDYIMDEFPEDSLVVIYSTSDENNIVPIVSDLLENDDCVVEGYGYYMFGSQLSAAEMADTMGEYMGEDSGFTMDEMYVDLLYYVYENGTENIQNLTFYQVMSFIISDEFLGSSMVTSMMDDSTLATLQQYSQYQGIFEGIYNETEYTSTEMADLLGMSSMSTYIGLLYTMKSATTMTVEDFLDATSSFSSYFGSYADQISLLQTMVPMIQSTQTYSPTLMAYMFSAMMGSSTDAAGESTAVQMDANTISLLYLLYWSQQADLSEVTMSLYDLLTFLCDDLVTNDVFASVIPEEYVSMLSAAQAMIEENIPQLHGDVYSRVILTITYVPESDEIYSFYETLNDTLANSLENDYYLVGSTAMSYELSLTFHSEYMLISILTAVVIFIVVCLTFRKFSVAAFLVCIIECAVFVTMSVMAAMNSTMYFIALMMVQCILMGSMVDYGILLSSYYKEIRRTLSKKDALPEVMKKSITAIITSAVIMICVCFIISFTVSGAIASILRILGIGCLSALILIIFFLPALLSVSDKLLTKSWKDIKPFREARKARRNGTAAPAEDSAEPAAAPSESEAEPAESGDAEPAKQDN